MLKWPSKVTQGHWWWHNSIGHTSLSISGVYLVSFLRYSASMVCLNCIKNKIIKYGEKRFSIWRIEFLHPAMWYVALGWHAIEFAQTSAILEFYSWFPFPHITAVDMSFCTNLRNFIQIGPPSQKKMTSCRFSRWRISAILDCRDPIMGSLKSPVKLT